MKLDPILDPTPNVLHGWLVEIRVIPASRTKPCRIKAVCETGVNENRKSITAELDYGNTTEQIRDLVVALIEKHNLNFLRNSVGKMSLSTFKTGFIVSLPL